jgi:hypothetical protein
MEIKNKIESKLTPMKDETIEITEAESVSQCICRRESKTQKERIRCLEIFRSD